MRKQFTFVESKTTEGLVEQLKQLAKKDNRNLNNFIGLQLKKIVNERQLEKNN